MEGSRKQPTLPTPGYIMASWSTVVFLEPAAGRERPGFLSPTKSLSILHYPHICPHGLPGLTLSASPLTGPRAALCKQPPSACQVVAATCTQQWGVTQKQPCDQKLCLGFMEQEPEVVASNGVRGQDSWAPG